MRLLSTHSELLKRRARRAAMAVLAALPTVWLPTPAHSASVYVAAKVSADATAKDAVTAKRRALATAEQRALEQVLKRLVPFGAYERLPVASASAIQGMLENFSVRSEQNSATRYIATLDYRFRAAQVRSFLQKHGIAFTEVQAPPVTVLPVYVEKGQVVSHGRDPWRQAWLALDLDHALTPVKLARHGSALTRETVEAIAGGDNEAFAALAEKHGTTTLVLAVAERAEDGARLATRLVGLDASGGLALARSDRVSAGDTAATARRAALVSLKIIEGRWKTTQAVPGDGEAAARHTVDLIVQFSGQAQWQEIKSRLARIPGVQALEVTSLSARSAAIRFRFPGGAPRLGGQLAAHNLRLDAQDGAWVLSSY